MNDPLSSKRITPEAEAGIRSRHSHVERSENKLGAAEAMAYLSHLDRAELLAEVECLRYLLNGARAYVCSFAELTQHPTARADAIKLVERIDGLRPDETTGLPVTQEPKYTVRDGRIVTRATGTPIPDDEPVFVLRAKDRNAVYAIMHYRSSCLGNPEHYQAVDSRVGDFLQFAAEHPLRMKYPDTSPGETSPLEPTTEHARQELADYERELEDPKARVGSPSRERPLPLKATAVRAPEVCGCPYGQCRCDDGSGVNGSRDE